MGKLAVWIIVLIIVIGGGWWLYQQGFFRTAEAGPIKVGFTGPLSGDLANLGTNARAAVEIAAEEINAAGGVGGRTLEVIYEDDQCVGAKASSAASKLINIDKVAAILGSTCSAATLSFAPMAEEAMTPVLAYCSTAPAITNAGDYIFRDVPSDLFQGKFAAEYAYNTLDKRKAAVVYRNDDWGVGLKNAFVEAFNALGGSVVVEEGSDPAAKDLRAQMTKVKNSGADFLFFPAFTDATIAGIKQAKELGIKIPIFGGDAWDDTKIWTELGVVGNGAMYTVVGTASSDAFKAAMGEKLGHDEIIYCSNYAYDGLKILVQAMKAAAEEGELSGETIKNALYQVNYTGGVSSPTIKFDSNGDPTEFNYVVKVVKDGKAEIAQ